ncbi:MAG: T9SS type A sorting domain-containing protein [Bacteroidota bacterium]|nr:T9SS type A sorting domain-containing protein [Bacteroidota bacterium]
MKQRMIHFILCLCLLVLVDFSLTQAKENPKGSNPLKRLAKIQTVDMYSSILINNVMNFYANNGSGSFNPTSGVSGFEYPKGSNKTAIYKDGLVWGGKHNGTLKVGGSTYSHGLQAGKIITSGTLTTPPVADNPSLDQYRVFRVRRDVSPSTAFLDVQDKMNEEIALLNRYYSLSALEVYNSYVRDWNEWPASDGAPFEDVNHNGSYEPLTDIPGVPGADQTLWHVSNDLDTARTTAFHGSNPIGLEVQRTIWAYRTSGALGSILFVKYKIINLSGHDIDSMYFSQWSDPDLGNATDDFGGCDTTLSLGYVYNSTNYDAMYGFPPPAAGFDFFQGPIVPASPGDRAIFDGDYRYGYKNLPMTSFNFFTQGDSRYTDPQLGSYNGTVQWYNLMRGLVGISGEQYIDPTTGQPTKFILAGDPLTNTGWRDGMLFSPGDRRIVLSSGPFTMADGDTQEIVVAELAAQGIDRLSSIAALRSTDRIAQEMYNSFFTTAQPEFSSNVTYPNGTDATIVVTAVDGIPHPETIRAKLFRNNGTLVDSLDLYDNGTHGDTISGDGIFNGSITIARERGAIYIDAEVFAGTSSLAYSRVVENVTTAGDIEILSSTILSDNLNNDGLINPGENIRFGFSVLNNTAFTLNTLTVFAIPDEQGRTFTIGNLAVSGEYSRTYNSTDPQTYFSWNISNGTTDTSFQFLVTITDTLNNIWKKTISIPIHPLAVRAYGTPITRITGNGQWTFSLKIVDRPSLKDHLYEISIDTVSGQHVFTLKDTTAGTTLLYHHALPDEYAHNIPVTDGFKLMRGDGWGATGLNKDSTRWISAFPQWFSGRRFTNDPHSAFSGGVTTGYQLGAVPYLGHLVSNFNYQNSVRVELRFDASVPQKAYRLRRTGPGTEYQLQTSVKDAAPAGEPFVNVPFQVWDMSDPEHPRQLTVSWRDQTDNALWDPPVDADGLEFVYIHFRTYDPLGRQFTYPANPEKPGEVINNELTMGAEADIMYGLSLGITSGHVISENPGTLLLVPVIEFSLQDRFTFRTETAPPVPTLSNPSFNSTNIYYRPRFWWSSSEGADTYRLQISQNDSLFSTIFYDDSTLTMNASPVDLWGTPMIKLLYGTKYYWRVKAKNIYGITAWSSPWNFTTQNTLVPNRWAFTSETGRNATIAIPFAINPHIGRRAMRNGDAIGVFFLRNDSSICGGYGYWKEDSNLVITVWGDNDQTTMKDGFAESESFQFRVWDGLLGRSYNANVSFQTGGITYVTNGIYQLGSFTGNTTITQGVPLQQGWNMISSFLNPLDSSLSTIFSDMISSMILMKNGKGQVFWPSLSVNTIGSWNVLHGYQIYTTAPDTMLMNGEESVPQLTPLLLNKGWNLISYLRNAGMGIDTSLTTIKTNLVIAKNNLGQIFAPSLAINTIGQMKPGQGYQLYLGNSSTLFYPGNANFAPPYLITKQAAEGMITSTGTPVRFKHDISPTASNAIAVIEWKGFQDGDEVAVRTAERKLIGSAVAMDGKVVVTIWGDNYMTEKSIEGAKENEGLQISTWSPKTQKYHEVSQFNITDLLNEEEKIVQLRYHQDAFWKISINDDGGIPTVYSLSQNYPNPFNPSTVIRYGLPNNSKVVVEVYNIIGQRVATLVNEEQTAGYYEVIFDAHRLSSGVYIYCIRAGTYKQAKKMLLLR